MFRWISQGRLTQKRVITTWRLIWVVVLLTGEFLVFRVSVTKCNWPSPYTPLSSDNLHPQRLLLIADPQVTDAYSYERQGLLLKLSEFYSDLYMQRSYRHLTQKRQPDKIVILGDLMDGGREWDDKGWRTQLKRFYLIFNKSATVPTTYLSGNHDIGIRDRIQAHIYERFQAEFGPTSSIQSLAYNHTLVTLDTVSLTNTDPQTTSIQQEALSIMDQMSSTTEYNAGKRVLFTHVPLFRPEQTPCGPFRVQSRPFIYQGYGIQYQNLLENELSQTVLRNIQPDLVFSGDDHDFCNVTHTYLTPSTQQQRSALEYTVPTFSMAQGVRQPGYMLLQATADALVPQLCWLPDQIGIFILYGLLASVTFILLFSRRILHWASQKSPEERRMMMTMTKTKNTDEEQLLASDVNRVNNFTPSASSSGQALSVLHGLVVPFLRDVKDVAIVAFPIYVACVLFL